MISFSARTASVVLLVTVACNKATVSTSSTIEFRHDLPAGFLDSLRGEITKLKLILNEPPGKPSLYSKIQAPVGATTNDGFAFTWETGDFDSDGEAMLEGLATVSGAVFENTTSWTLALSGGPLGDGFYAFGKVYRNVGGNWQLLAEAQATSIEGGGAIQFGGGLKRVVLSYQCANGVACAGATDGGLDAGVGPDAGGDAGTGSSPAVLSLSDNPLADFGTVVAGGSAAKLLTVTNVGGMAATLGAVSTSALGLAPPFTLDGGTCSTGASVLADGGSCSVVIQFSPTDAGVMNDSVDFTYANGIADASASRAVQGVAVWPGVLSISDGPTYSYNTVIIGAKGNKAFTVTNSGGAASTLGTVTTAGLGLASPFGVGDAGTCGAAVVLAANGGSCILNVEFEPTQSGDAGDTIELSYSNGLVDTVALCALSGNGQKPASLDWSNNPSYNFGTVIVGASGGTTLTVTNSGETAATLGTVSAAGLGLSAPFGLDGGSCTTSGSVAADGGQCNVAIAFTPTDAGAMNGLVDLGYSNGVADASASRALQGTAAWPALLSISDGPTYPFGSVFVGATGNKSFTVTNSGGVASMLGTVSTSGLGLASPFGLAGGGTCTTNSVVSANGGACTLNIVFVPVASGAANDSIDLTYTNGLVADAGASRAITGTGVNPAALTWSDFPLLDFGSALVGGSVEKTLTVTNSGETAAALGTVSTAGLGLAAPFWFDGGTCATGGVVAADGGSCAVSIVFAPTTAGFADASVGLSYNNGASNQVASRALTGQSPQSPTGSVKQVAPGFNHTCALLAAGNVRCWGNGDAGQLGYGNTNSLYSPGGDVSVGGDVIQIASGSNFSCALLSNGKVRCWGSGSQGRLGYGNWNSIGDNEFPSDAGDVSVDPDGGVVQIATGNDHVCALLATGKVRCWGMGTNGRLGYGNANDVGGTSGSIPSDAGFVSIGGDVTQISAGDRHSCVLLSTGKVRCWGYGAYGQLGYGHANNIGDDAGEFPSVAGDVSVGGDAIQISAGGDHACALLSTGKVRCWGRNNVGQLGYGHMNNVGDTSNNVPSDAGDVSVGSDVIRIVAGGGHTCVVLAGGTVRCWGWGDSGRLGYGNTNNVGREPWALPSDAGDMEVGGGQAVVDISSYRTHTCALFSTGKVRCWGGGYNGQLGYGNTNTIGDNEYPSDAGDVSVGGYAKQISAGGNHTCAILSSGKIRCWGDGAYGAIGYGNTNDIGDDAGEFPSTLAYFVDVGGDAKLVSAGTDHTCAVLSTGNLRCWGRGDKGRLGYGNMNNVGDSENPSNAGDVSVGADVVQLSAGYYHTCVVLSTGKLRCWGSGTYGKLGFGNTLDIGDDAGEYPSMAGDVSVGGDARQVSAGHAHTCVVLSSGNVRCWGDGWVGRLGYGNTENIGDDAGEYPSTAGDVRVGGEVKQISAGGVHTCAVLSTGKVRCWGFGGYFGQLGYGNTENIGDDAGEYPSTAGDVNVGGDVIKVALGEFHTCALLAKGTVRCWGQGGYLGYGNMNSIGDNELPSDAGDVPVW